MTRLVEPSGLRLAEPRWPFSLAFAALAAAAFCWPVWPGFMSYDSLLAYGQTFTGVQTLLWPPMHTYMFAASRALGLSAGGVLAFQTFALFLGAALTINLTARDRRLATALCLVFALSFVAIPPMWGTLAAQWRDAPTASFTALGLALWLLAARHRRIALVAAAAVAFGCALALRYNAVALVLPLMALMAAWPFLAPAPGPRRRAVAIGAVLASLALAWGSTHWRLPDFARLPAPDSFGGTEEFDLIGVSACADRSYLPAAITDGEPITPYQLREIYDPEHLQLTLRPRADVPQLEETDAGADGRRAWIRALREHPGCYLSHRSAVFVEQMGLARGHVFYPVHGQIDPNGFGLALAHPQAAKAVTDYINGRAPQLWRRPFLLYLAAAALGLAAVIRRRDFTLLGLALLVACCAYPALLFLAAPAADARYIFPSNVMCALLSLMSVGLLSSSPRSVRPS